MAGVLPCLVSSSSVNAILGGNRNHFELVVFQLCVNRFLSSLHNSTASLDKTVCQSRLTVDNMSDNAEVSNVYHGTV
jgi:hypothetical protein